MSPQQVADRYGKHPVTVRLALSDRSLHGESTGHGIEIAKACAEAWANGEQCQHHASIVREAVNA